MNENQQITQPTLEMLDPRILTVDVNVRKDAALTPAFVASIKEHGVIEPVIGHRRDNGEGTSTVHVSWDSDAHAVRSKPEPV